MHSRSTGNFQSHFIGCMYSSALWAAGLGLAAGQDCARSQHTAHLCTCIALTPYGVRATAAASSVVKTQVKPPSLRKRATVLCSSLTSAYATHVEMNVTSPQLLPRISKRTTTCTPLRTSNRKDAMCRGTELLNKLCRYLKFATKLPSHADMHKHHDGPSCQLHTCDSLRPPMYEYSAAPTSRTGPQTQLVKL